jgi:membrane-anchored protein YejM (alkaline phosphatase superfamily)
LREAIQEKDEQVKVRELKRAYRENLKIVLAQVSKLLPHLEGKTVLTADHGEMLGDRYKTLPLKDYGHYAGIYNEALTRVPWHIVKDENRKRIIEDPPEQQVVANEATEQNLRNLGYVMQ